VLTKSRFTVRVFLLGTLLYLPSFLYRIHYQDHPMMMTMHFVVYRQSQIFAVRSTLPVMTIGAVG